MKIVLASRNQKKIKELQSLLISDRLDIQVLSLDDIGYTEEIIEDGESFEENSIIKACVPASLGYIGVADDSGLTVDSLGGEPGIYSARYSGEGADDEKNNSLLLDNMRDVPDGDRTASFVCTIAMVLPREFDIVLPDGLFVGDRKAESRLGEFKGFTVRGEAHGIILKNLVGSGGFGYDPLFYSQDAGKTFAELSPEEKNRISHRGQAMSKFKEILLKIKELNR